ncbi:ion transport peptide-like isoform X1 [Hetaerina americana]|uniref:ion transport peptide-like isoform X1 n=1 Tax=Hetaerina americana TaxID=62018 RepID=UPI003A7F1748
MQPSTIASSGLNSSSSRRLRGAAAGGAGSLPGLPVLLPILLLLLAASGVISPPAVEAGPLGSSEEIRTGSGSGHVLSHTLSKRSFFDIQCKGVYDKSIFARLDRICEDCYNLFREPQLHSLCRKNCFTTEYFKGCLDVLLLTDEMENIQTWIKQLHGADPGV